MKEYDVLVLDSRYKHSLAVIRSLGIYGLKVIGASEKFSPSKYSRYCLKNFRYKKESFRNDLLNILKQNKIKFVLCVDYFTNIECSKIKHEILNYSKILIADYEIMNMVSNKESIIKIISERVCLPKSYFLNNINDIDKIDFNCEKFVIKSVIENKGKKVEYFETKEELIKIIDYYRKELGPQIVQEYIKGFGCGFFALCDQGKIISSFQHKRLYQYPETGGISSIAQTFYNDKLNEISKQIITNIKWTGFCMLEFIYNELDDKFYFIEFNPKLWGSLDLSIKAGADFPVWYIKYLNNEKVQNIHKYKNIIFQWKYPEELLRIKTSGNKKEAKEIYKKFWKNKKVCKDIDYLKIDPLPTLIKIIASYILLLKK